MIPESYWLNSRSIQLLQSVKYTFPSTSISTLCFNATFLQLRKICVKVWQKFQNLARYLCWMMFRSAGIGSPVIKEAYETLSSRVRFITSSVLPDRKVRRLGKIGRGFCVFVKADGRKILSIALS